MENMEIYEKFRVCPQEAQKKIEGGRLKGFTDINPMWRIKALTEQFGPCGIGWYIEIVDKWVETSMAADEITTNVLINLYVKEEGEWSRAIAGFGGNKVVSKEKAGLYVDDESYKKAFTDAIGQACKMLGMAADIYWNQDATKYIDKKKDDFNADANKPIGEEIAEQLLEVIKAKNQSPDYICKYRKVDTLSDLTYEQYGEVMEWLRKK